MTANPAKRFLHVGCGTKNKSKTTVGFNTDAWDEVRYDIDPEVNPDVLGSMTDMSTVADASMDAVFSSHSIEHLYAHDVPVALKEFRRVLKADGILVITCPDLQAVCALVANNKLTEPIFMSPAGPIAPLDILYGLRSALSDGHLFMAHRCGFTKDVLTATLLQAGFATVQCVAPIGRLDLWAVASKAPLEPVQIEALMQAHRFETAGR